ncbi:MAG: NTP transferase domain-containing protein [Steroidobacteraceae bacterium]
MKSLSLPRSLAAPRLQAVILAAGFSSRLGSAKPMARVGSLSLLRSTIARVSESGPAAIIVVVPRRASSYRMEARGFKVSFAPNPRRAEGLASSVRLGLRRARFSAAVLLLPIDLALLRRRDIHRLISRWRARRRCVVARCVGGGSDMPRGAVPLILPRWLYGRAQSVTGDIGLRGLVSELPPSQRILLPLPSAALDIDTPEDLRAVRRRPRALGARL